MGIADPGPVIVAEESAAWGLSVSMYTSLEAARSQHYRRWLLQATCEGVLSAGGRIDHLTGEITLLAVLCGPLRMVRDGTTEAARADGRAAVCAVVTHHRDLAGTITGCDHGDGP